MSTKIADLRKMFGGGTSNARQFGMIFTLGGIILLFQVLTDGLTLDPINLIALVSQFSYILILAIGMVMVIIAGHIDLSVGSVAALAGIVVATAMKNFDLPWPLAILLGLLIGALIGAWQGFWVAYIGVPAFIVTLSGYMLFRGMNQFIGNAQTIPVPAGFRDIGAGYLPEIGPNTGRSNLTLVLGLLVCIAVIIREIRLRKMQAGMGAAMAPGWVSGTKVGLLVAVITYASLLFAGGRVGTSFPYSGIILGVLVVLYSFVTNNTIFGRHVYAVGGNALAARLSGVKSKRVNFMVMMNMSILASLAGMIFVARSAASGPQDGIGWELDAIAAVFIGGAAVSGGVGTVIGSIVGGLVMAVLNNGLQLLGVGSDRVQMIKGLVLLIAVAVDVYNKSQGKPSLIGFMTRGFHKEPGSARAGGAPPLVIGAPGAVPVTGTEDLPPMGPGSATETADPARPGAVTPN